MRAAYKQMGATWSNFKSKVSTSVKKTLLWSLIAIATFLLLFLVYKGIVGSIKKSLWKQIQLLESTQPSGDQFLRQLKNALQTTS